MQNMKTVLFVHLFISLIVFSADVVTAQSGRVPTPKTEMESSPIPLPTKAAQCEPSPDNQEKYRYIVAQGIDNFFTELNKLGKSGYRLKSLTKAPLVENEFSRLILAAIVVQTKPCRVFDYGWFLADNPSSAVGGMQRYEKQNFVFRDTVDLELNNPNNVFTRDESLFQFYEIITPSVFILEREAGRAVDYEYRIETVSGLDDKSMLELHNHIDKMAAEDFRPVAFLREAWSSYSILFERNNIEQIIETAKYKLIKRKREAKEADLLAEANILKQLGYKIILIHSYGVVLVAEGNQKEKRNSTKYFVFNGASKNSAIELTALAKRNVVFSQLMSYFHPQSTFEGKLLFEESDLTSAISTHYQLQVMSGNLWIGNEKKKAPLIPPTPEMLNGFGQRIKEGYEPRELFYGKYGLTVLFERQNN